MSIWNTPKWDLTKHICKRINEKYTQHEGEETYAIIQDSNKGKNDEFNSFKGYRLNLQLCRFESKIYKSTREMIVKVDDQPHEPKIIWKQNTCHTKETKKIFFDI